MTVYGEPIYLPQSQHRRQSHGMSFNPLQMHNLYSNFSGGGGGYGGGGGGGYGGGGFMSTLGSMWPFAAVGAAIAAQQIMAQNTDTIFEGQRSGGATSGNFFTEPWMAFLSQEMGWEPTAGEKMDAAIKNRDFGSAVKRMPGAIDYWADPFRGLISHGIQNVLGKKPAMFLDPIGSLFSWLGD